MKTSKMTLVKTAVILGLLVGLSNAALADTKINIGLGFGRRGLNRSHRPKQKFFRRPSRLRENQRLRERRRETVILGRGCRSGRWSNYCAVTTPIVIKRTPVVVEKQTVIVQPAEYDEDTQALFETLRHRKSQLLIYLQTGDKEQRKDAIKELAGFSFDDTVRQVLEDIMLSDPDVELRKEAIRAFAEVKNTQALPALEKARVEDSRQSVREEADEAIKKIRGY